MYNKVVLYCIVLLYCIVQRTPTPSKAHPHSILVLQASFYFRLSVTLLVSPDVILLWLTGLKAPTNWFRQHICSSIYFPCTRHYAPSFCVSVFSFFLFFLFSESVGQVVNLDITPCNYRGSTPLCEFPRNLKVTIKINFRMGKTFK